MGFVRDEKRTYPFTWLTIGGLFALSTFWAVYAEVVTRVPWQTHQEAFFDMEHELSKQALEAEQAKWEAAKSTEPLKGQIARLAELDQTMASGDYAKAKARLAELKALHDKAEVGKTFGGSDLDETYYYRNLAEYERDVAAVKVRKLYAQIYVDQPERAAEPAGFYADPQKPAKEEGDSEEMHHLKSEVARMQAHITALETAEGTSNPPELVKAIKASIAAEKKVQALVKTEEKHQARVDTALAEMAKFQGPAEPAVNEPDGAKRDAAVAKARAAVCGGEAADTMKCIAWTQLGPIDEEYKALTISVSKAKRPLMDARLRVDKASAKAEPKLNLNDPVGSLVGPFQIQQIVTSWMDAERDVDLQQVDRCNTCHMGVDSNLYTDASVAPQFRTHPRRDELLKAHPVAEFGCTSCHQGQGRATDDFAHSRWVLEVKHGHERWHYVGDHYWEDPMLPTGSMTKVVIDDQNDVLEVKLGKGKKAEIKLDHRVPQGTVEDEHSKDPEVLALTSSELRFLEELQTKLQAVVAADEKLAKVYKAVARRIDNRIQIGFELLPGAEAPKKAVKLTIGFPKLDLAKTLGFGAIHELSSKAETLFVAPNPPRVPIRATSRAAEGTIVDTKKDYAFTPPSGAQGLQVPDEMRNRLIQGLPEIESGCLRCHNQDVDLYPRRSHQGYVNAKLAYQHAEAELAADPKAYVARHGTTDLPKVPEPPAEAQSLAPTLDHGKALFAQLNCTGCHLLEGYENNTNAGPQLNDISAKTDPKWMLTWLRDPRGWRAKTSMPNLWPRPVDPASKIPYPEGSPEYAKWDKERSEETVAIAAYLYEMSESPAKRPGATPAEKPLSQTIAGYADVEGADAKKGKLYFEAYGCQGCHSTLDKGAEVPEAWRKRERDIAPTLSSLGSKTNADWLAYWIEQPNRYWHGTSMPNLRLSRQEAASVAQYLMSMTGEPARPLEVPDAEVSLVSDPKKRAELVPCARAGGQQLSRVDCGKKVIAYRGCYGCHNIDGFEKLAPIGPELTGFAKKDISTLDYGYAITDHHLQTTESFAALKLDSPRIYSRDRIELKMGDYDMSADEIRALVTFIKGTVPAQPNEKFDPTGHEDYAAALEGRRLVNDLNCRGCHLIEGRGADIDGWRLAKLTADGQRRAPFLDGEGARVQPEWLFEFLRNPGDNGIRPWLHPEWAYDEVPDDKLALRMPTFNLSPEQWTQIVRYFASWDKQAYPFEVPKVPERTTQEKLWAVSNMNSAETGNCFKCHYYDEFPVEKAKGDLKAMAPNMNMVRNRLRPEWVKNWLLRPANYLPYTSMTAFFASADRPKDAARWPKENDPYVSAPPKGWQGIIGPDMRTLTTEEHALLIRDLLFSIPEDADWPKPGEEASSEIVDPEAAATVAESDEEEEVIEQPGG